MRTPSRFTLPFILLTLFTAGPAQAQNNDSLIIFDEEWSLDYEKTMVRRMDAGINRYFDRYNRKVINQRSQYWNRDVSSGQAYARSVESNRSRLRKILGLVDQRVPVYMERFGRRGDSPVIAETDRYIIEQVRWPALEGVWGEGLLMTPKGRISSRVVALPDAGQLPEELAGMGAEDGATNPFALRLVESGAQVLVPVLINRQSTFSQHAIAPWSYYRGDASLEHFATNQTHREWIYRQAYVNGRHIIGMELQKVFAGIDWFLEQAQGSDPMIGVAGYGEGGLLALYAGAVDDRIDATLVSGYFGPREDMWQEPVYRNVWGLLKRFGDAEIASLIAPRSLVVEYSNGPEVDGPPPAPEGVHDVATGGKITTPPFAEVQEEIDRLRSFFEGGALRPDVAFIHGSSRKPAVTAGSDRALAAFAEDAGLSSLREADRSPTDRRKHFDPEQRQGEQIRELTDFFHDLVDNQDRVRYAHMEGDWSSPKAWHASMAPYRKEFREEIIGRVDQELLPANPRLRKVYDTDTWTGYEVVLDVWPEVFAWGLLAVPKDVEPDEKRPTVVVQHGHSGTPSTPLRVDSYNNILPRLAKRGFVVFAPHNPYQFNVRKATPLKATVFSVIIPQYRQIVNWLKTHEHVDADRIGFYGKSWGGRTALRVPTYIEEFKLSISSAYFNQWPRKVLTQHYRTSYMYEGSIGVYEFNMGPTFGHAEMAMLMAPKPFMVEAGYNDAVAPSEWVGYEFAKVKRVYDMIGAGDKAVLGFHVGGHEVHGDTIFPFLHKHLQWPVPATE